MYNINVNFYHRYVKIYIICNDKNIFYCYHFDSTLYTLQKL